VCPSRPSTNPSPLAHFSPLFHPPKSSHLICHCRSLLSHTAIGHHVRPRPAPCPLPTIPCCLSPMWNFGAASPVLKSAPLFAHPHTTPFGRVRLADAYHALVSDTAAVSAIDKEIDAARWFVQSLLSCRNLLALISTLLPGAQRLQHGSYCCGFTRRCVGDPLMWSLFFFFYCPDCLLYRLQL